MNRLQILGPSSCGLLLLYKCTSECRHCMYACSPKWNADWISDEDAELILHQLARRIKGSPFGPDMIGINHGLHFTGGEPFMNFDLLLRVTKIADKLKIPSTFVETNCYWAKDDGITRDRLKTLKDAGLHGILVSVNPFILEHVPFERTKRVARVSNEMFRGSTVIYQQYFYEEFKRLGIEGTMPFEEYLRKAPSSLHCVELLPMGRAVYRLGNLFNKRPAERFFGISCMMELIRDWHVHIDNYGNYTPGYCGGISMGNARDLNLLCSGIALDDKPILKALTIDLKDLYQLGVKEYDYKESNDGYVSKCHLCVDIRRHIAQQTDKYSELKPKEFYSFL